MTYVFCVSCNVSTIDLFLGMCKHVAALFILLCCSTICLLEFYMRPEMPRRLVTPNFQDHIPMACLPFREPGRQPLNLERQSDRDIYFSAKSCPPPLPCEACFISRFCNNLKMYAICFYNILIPFHYIPGWMKNSHFHFPSLAIKLRNF